MTKLYLATSFKNDIVNEYAKNILVSYYYAPLGLIDFYGKTHDMMLDSGAFTFSWKSEKYRFPDIEYYSNMCHKYKYELDSYANMDVIGSDVETFENQDIMESFNLKPFPIFHNGDDFEYLIHYLKNYDYIGLGGVAGAMAGTTRQSSSKWIGKVIQYIVKYNPTIKTHAFGVTSQNEMIKYRFYSCDSSSWMDAFRFNKFQKYLGNGDIVGKKDVGFRFGDLKLATKRKQTLIEWGKISDYVDKIIPTSEEPFRTSELRSLGVD